MGLLDVDQAEGPGENFDIIDDIRPSPIPCPCPYSIRSKEDMVGRGWEIVCVSRSVRSSGLLLSVSCVCRRVGMGSCSW